MSNQRQSDPAAQFARPDLEAIGVVLARPDHRGTTTLWCDPAAHPDTLFEEATEAGQAPVALLLVFAAEVEVHIRAEWQGARWVTSYVERVARGIQSAGGWREYLTHGLSADEVVTDAATN